METCFPCRVLFVCLCFETSVVHAVSLRTLGSVALKQFQQLTATLMLTFIFLIAVEDVVE